MFSFLNWVGFIHLKGPQIWILGPTLESDLKSNWIVKISDLKILHSDTLFNFFHKIKLAPPLTEEKSSRCWFPATGKINKIKNSSFNQDLSSLCPFSHILRVDPEFEAQFSGIKLIRNRYFLGENLPLVVVLYFFTWSRIFFHEHVKFALGLILRTLGKNLGPVHTVCTFLRRHWLCIRWISRWFNFRGYNSISLETHFPNPFEDEFHLTRGGKWFTNSIHNPYSITHKHRANFATFFLRTATHI